MNTDELHKALGEMQELGNKSRKIRNNILLDEECFYKLTLRFKKSVSRPLFKQPPDEFENENFRRKFNPVVMEVDAFEKMVDEGKLRIFGKALIQKQLYQRHLEQLRSALQKAEQAQL